MGLGNRLIKIRKEHGYTREALAHSLGISKFTLRNYELGTNEPGHAFLKQFSDLFHVSVDYLMGLTDTKDLTETFKASAEEQSIIEKYRNLDEHGKELIDIILDKESKRSYEERIKKYNDKMTK